VQEIIDAEVNSGSWTLMHRYNKCYDILNSIDVNDEKALMWIYIWLRYSFIRQLTWQKNFNTKPRELSHAMSRLTTAITSKLCSFLDKRETEFFNLNSYILLRMLLTTLGKGTGDGQAIRDQILHILHKHHIKETNDHFYEQWHQKLHNNTTPDDIVICEAVIAFQRSGGKMNMYWDTLKAGGVTKERLSSFERKIICEPYYFPEILPDLEGYLQTLKAVHSSSDINTLFESTKYAFGDQYELFNDILKNKDHWDTLKQICRVTKGREALQNLISRCRSDVNKSRDLIFFDICLESYMRQLVEKMVHVDLQFEQYLSEINEITKNINATFSFKELKLTLEDFWKICLPVTNLEADSALRVKSVCDRFSRILTSIVDNFTTQIDSKAKHLGESFHAEEFAISLFTEEIIRGSIFFALSMILKKVEPIIRKVANLGVWHIISPGKSGNVSHGIVEYVKNLRDVQFKKYDHKTILLTEIVGGNEEIPLNITCLIMIYSKDYPDVLSHVSVRARNLGVPFFICFEDSISDNIKQFLKKTVKVINKGKNIEFTESSEKIDISNEDMPKKIQSLKTCSDFRKVVLTMEEFTKDYVGSKSNNSKRVFGNLPEWVKYPQSSAIPFNVCEYYLELEENKSIKQELEKCVNSVENTTNAKLLQDCKNLIMKLTLPNEDLYTKELKTSLLNLGVSTNDIPKALEAIKEVWASKYNERAFISVSKIGINLNDIRMAVLIQKIIPAEYAFVIHTKNPSNNDENELYAEMVYGMGETLVGKHEGQALSFIFNKTKDTFSITSYPNKSVSLVAEESFIFRSDSNTEDLEGFAGAGLFDSIPLTKLKEVHMSYHECTLMNDKKKTEELIRKISKLGIAVEKIYNFPQDIEGVIYKDEIYIVQTRPQV
jgi:alpha-glucan,water dikinase